MLIIDRFEGDFAVVEDSDSEKMYNIPINQIEKGAVEGDVIYFENELYHVDFEQTKKRRAEMLALLKNMGLCS